MADAAKSAFAFGVKDTGIVLLVSALTEAKKGDIVLRQPTGPIGATWPIMPEALRRRLSGPPFLQKVSKTIVTHHASVRGVEVVSIELECTVQYNGPEVQATFGLLPAGMRSRLGVEAQIEIRNPLALEREYLPPTLRKDLGFDSWPILYVPISVIVDYVWPSANSKETFNLVLSGRYGLGKSAEGDYKDSEKRVDD